MKHQNPPSSPLADEQLLFTPEEMSGDLASDSPAVGAEADAPDKEDTPDMLANDTADKAQQDAEETDTDHEPTTRKQPVESEPQQTDMTQQPTEQHSYATTQHTLAQSSHSAHQADTNDAFTDEERIITEMTIALEFTDGLSLGEVRLIALEASVIWQNGVTPSGTYAIQSMPRYTFDGYKFLALYYVTFYRAFPSMIEKLNLPYDRLYLLARRRYDGYRTKH